MSSPSSQPDGRRKTVSFQLASHRRTVSSDDLPTLRLRLSYVSRQEMKGISALKEEIAKVKAIMDLQKEPVHKSQSIIHTTEMVIRATKLRLAKMEKENGSEQITQKLKKQITGLESYVFPKQQHVHVWEGGGKGRWGDLKFFVDGMEEQLMEQEALQDPHELKKYLETERSRLDGQKQEVLRARQSIKQAAERIGSLRNKMVELAGKGYDYHLATFADRGCKLEEEIDAQQRRLRRAHEMVRTWEKAEGQWKYCCVRLEKASTRASPKPLLAGAALRSKSESLLNGASPGSSPKHSLNGASPGSSPKSSLNGASPRSSLKSLLGAASPKASPKHSLNGASPGSSRKSSLNGTSPGSSPKSSLNGASPRSSPKSSVNGASPRSSPKSLLGVTSPRTSPNPMLQSASPRASPNLFLQGASPRTSINPFLQGASPKTCLKPLLINPSSGTSPKSSPRNGSAKTSWKH